MCVPVANGLRVEDPGAPDSGGGRDNSTLIPESNDHRPGPVRSGVRLAVRGRGTGSPGSSRVVPRGADPVVVAPGRPSATGSDGALSSTRPDEALAFTKHRVTPAPGVLRVLCPSAYFKVPVVTGNWRWDSVPGTSSPGPLGQNWEPFEDVWDRLSNHLDMGVQRGRVDPLGWDEGRVTVRGLGSGVVAVREGRSGPPSLRRLAQTVPGSVLSPGPSTPVPAALGADGSGARCLSTRARRVPGSGGGRGVDRLRAAPASRGPRACRVLGAGQGRARPRWGLGRGPSASGAPADWASGPGT